MSNELRSFLEQSFRSRDYAMCFRLTAWATQLGLYAPWMARLVVLGVAAARSPEIVEQGAALQTLLMSDGVAPSAVNAALVLPNGADSDACWQALYDVLSGCADPDNHKCLASLAALRHFAEAFEKERSLRVFIVHLASHTHSHT
jgi:hypothetical protein